MKLFKNFYLIFISMTLIFVSMLCGGCDKSEGKIDFSELQENSTINSIPEKTPLRIAFASVISPIDTRKSYHVLIDELSRQLDQPVVLIQKKTYEELNVLLANGEADIAFLSTGAYISYKGAYPIELLAMIKTNDTIFYDTYLITAKDSDIESFDDLYHKTIAFTDPASFSGKLVIDNILSSKNTTVEEYFYRYFYTYNHDKSILAVANHLADAASVDSQVYDYTLKKNPDIIKQIKIIDVLEKAPSGPIVIRKDIDKETKAKIQNILFNIHTVKNVKEALNKVMIDQFVVQNPELYENLKQKYKIK